MALKLERYKGFFQWKHNPKGVTSIDEERSEEFMRDVDSEASMTENEDSSIAENSVEVEQHLSVARRLCFAASLLSCVFTVFVFAFLLPCHQPGCNKTNSCLTNFSKNWSVNFSSSIPSAVTFLDVTGSGHLDVLVEATKGCEDGSCTAEITALRGETGKSLWALLRDTSPGLLTCNQFKHPSCLLAEKNSHLLKIDGQMGSVEWLALTQHTIHAYEFVKDTDGDGVQDVVVLHDAGAKPSIGVSADKANISIISGASGSLLGMPVSVPGKHNSSSSILVVYNSLQGLQFILVGSMSHAGRPGSLWAISTADLAKKIDPDGVDKGNSSQWGLFLPNHWTGFTLLFDGIFVLVKPLLVDLNSDDVTDLVVCIKDPGLNVVALDGKTLGTLWKLSLSSFDVDRLIAVGKPKENNYMHIAVIVMSVNHTSELWVIDGQSGDVTWSFRSDTVFPVPPVSIHITAAKSQAFLMWLPESEAVKYLKDNGHKTTGRNNGVQHTHYGVTSENRRYGTDRKRITRNSQNSVDTNIMDPDYINSGENTPKESVGKEKRNAEYSDGYQGDATAAPVTSLHDYCGSKSGSDTPTWSAFLVSHHGTVKVDHVVSEKAIYLDPKEFESLFGQKLSTQQCVKLVPKNIVEPVVGDVDGSGEIELVYAVEFVTDESAGSNHLMKIQKLNIEQAV